MKKILWLIILIPIFMTRAWASETYYSEYTDFSNYQEEKIEKSDTVNVEEVTMYKWYKEIIVPGEYKLYNTVDNFTDDCYETQYSNWSSSKTQQTEATILDERVMYNYQMIKPIRYIHLYNLDGSFSSFRITELQTFYNDEEINYTYSCVGCWQNFDKYIHNGVYAENMSIIDDGGSLIIDLGKEYPIDKIKLVIYLFDMGSEDKKYTIGFSNDGQNVLFNRSYSQQFELYYAKDSIRYEYSLKDFNIDNDLWLYQLTDDKYIDNDFVYNRTSYNEYRYKERLCRMSTIEKEYYPQYSINSVGEYTLRDSPKTFNRYQTRDKLQLSIHDITEKYYDLNNFVLYNSDKYTINHNIDWEKNGTYNINFILNEIYISKNVNVNILSNAIAEKEDEINDLKEQFNNAVEDYQKIIEKLEKNNQDYLNNLNTLNNEIIEINKKIEDIQEKDVEQNEDILRLREYLELKIQEHNNKIIELENTNKLYLENLNVLATSINNIEKRLSLIENENFKEQILSLRTELNEYIKEYLTKIEYLEQFNNNSIKQLENINLSIENLNEYLNQLETVNNELDDKIQNNTNSIIKIRDELNNHLEEFTKISLEFDKIKEQIENEHSNNKKLYNDFENIKQQMNDNVKYLKEKIENIQLEIISIDNENEINDQRIKKLYDEIENYIFIYKNELEKSNEFNINCSNKLDTLDKEITSLNKQLEMVFNNEEENDIDIEKIKEEIKNYKIQYNTISTNLNTFNQDYLNNLKDIDYEFKNLFIKISDIEMVNNEKINSLNELIKQNSSLLDSIHSNNNEKYKQIIPRQDNINNIVTNNIENITYLKKLNQQFILEIQILEDEIKKLSTEINQIKQNENENYKKINSQQNLIYEQLLNNSNDILSIRDNQIISNEDFENLKNQVLHVSNVLNKTDEVQGDNLNTKLNDYMLKINGVEIISLLWIYVILTIVFGVYLLYLFKKSRTKK